MTLPPTYVAGFHDENAVRKMKYNDFGTTGMKVSKLSLGAAGFSTIYGDYTLEECRETLITAFKSGINYVDTAYWYGQGQSEQNLGECLKDIPRQAYYLATKIGRYEKDPSKMFDFSAEKTRSAIKIGLERLGVDYVDILQIHDIEFAPSIEYLISETLPVMLEAVKNGKVKHIGVTGYVLSKLAEFVKKSPVKIDMILSYSRLTLIDSSLNDYLNDFKDIGIVNAAGLAMGLLASGGPQPWHPAHKNIKDVCDEARNYCKDNGVELAKLAMCYIYDESAAGIPNTHLIGMNSRHLLDINLDSLINGLTEKEKVVLQHIKDSMLPKLQYHHWEGMEKY